MSIKTRVSRLERHVKPGEKIRQIVISDVDHGSYRMNGKPITEAKYRALDESGDYQIIEVIAPD